MNTELMEKIKSTDIFQTLKHSKNYFSADIATKAMAFISIPVFTRLLTQADYGIVAVFLVYVGITTIILSLNTYSAVGRYYYEKKSDFGEFIGTTLIFISLIFIFTIPIYLLFHKQIAVLTQLPGLLPIYLLFACLFAILDSLYYQILVPQKKSKEAAILRILKAYITFGIAVLFVYLLKENRYLGQIWANLLVGLFFSIYFMRKISKYSKFSFNMQHIKYISTYSLPLIPYALSGIILNQFDRIMVNNIIGTASAGLYSLGYNVGMLLLMVIVSTQTALIPDFFRFLDNKEYNRLDELLKKVFCVVIITGLVLFLFAKEIGTLLADEKFHKGLSVVPIVVIGYVFYEMFVIYGMYPGYKKKTIFSFPIVFSAGIANILLNAIFIPKYGYMAAAYTTVASYFIMFLMAWIVAKFILKERITPLWIIWKPTLIMFSFIILSFLIMRLNPNAILFFSIKLLMLVMFSSIVFYEEIKIALNLVHSERMK